MAVGVKDFKTIASFEGVNSITMYFGGDKRAKEKAEKNDAVRGLRTRIFNCPTVDWFVDYQLNTPNYSRLQLAHEIGAQWAYCVIKNCSQTKHHYDAHFYVRLEAMTRKSHVHGQSVPNECLRNLITKVPVVHLTQFQNGMIFPLVSGDIAAPTGLPTRVLRSRSSDSRKQFVLLGVMQDAEAVYRALAVAGKFFVGQTSFSFPQMTTFHNIVGENSSLAKVWKSATTKQDDLSFGSDDGTTFR